MTRLKYAPSGKGLRGPATAPPATEPQQRLLRALRRELGIEGARRGCDMSVRAAEVEIGKLLKRKARRRAT